MSPKAAINLPRPVFVTYPELPRYGVPPYSRVHLMRMMRRNQFPQQIQLSPNRVAWRLSDIVDWVSNRSLSQKTRPETLGIVLAIIIPLSAAVPLWNAAALPAPIPQSSHMPQVRPQPTGIPDFGHQAGKGTIYPFEPRGGKSAALNASPITAQGQILALAHDDVAAGGIAPRVQHDQTHRDWRRRIRREVATMSPQLSSHRKGEHDWIGLPAREWTDAEGKRVFTVLGKFSSHGDARRFSEAAIAAIKLIAEERP
jgi:hypothetical protein